MLKNELLILLKNRDFDDLKDCLINQIICPTEKIFDSSKNFSDENIIYCDLTEDWKSCGWKYQISNLGRIRFRASNFVIPQINKNSNLFLDPQKWKEKCQSLSIESEEISSDCLIYYEYIAPTWLSEEKDFAKECFKIMFEINPESCLEIHHINNNENDNRINNLIYLNSDFHKKIHIEARSFIK